MLSKEDVEKTIVSAAIAHFDAMFGVDFENRKEEVAKAFEESGIANRVSPIANREEKATIPDTRYPIPESADDARKLIEEKAKLVAENPMARNQLLGILDMLWMTNLEDLEALQESVGLRAYGQRDPLVEYRQEASRLFKAFWVNYNGWVFMNRFKLLGSGAQMANRRQGSACLSHPKWRSTVGEMIPVHAVPAESGSTARSEREETGGPRR